MRIIIFSVIFTLLVAGCDSRVIPGPVDCNQSDLSLETVSISNSSDCIISDGVVVLEAMGGVGDYSFSLNGTDFQLSGTFESVGAGNYNALVRDGSGCEREVSVTVFGNTQLSIDGLVVTESGCGQSDGSITVNASGGQNIEYSINGAPFDSNNIFTNLASDMYTVTIRDDTGCTFSESVKLPTGMPFSTIKAVIDANCSVAGCHVSGGDPGQSRNFQVDQNIVNNAQNIIRVIYSTNPGEMMPPPNEGSLTEEQKQQIACWVEDGANLN